MPLSPSYAWLEAFDRADCKPVFHIAMTNGTVSLSCVTDSMSPSSDLFGTEVGAISVSAFSSKLDPLTREVTTQAVFVDFRDEWIRPWIVLTPFKNMLVTVKIGTSDLDESDFVAYCANAMIEELTPIDRHTARAMLIGQFRLLEDTITSKAYWLGKHPLECLYAGDGSGLLELAGCHGFNAGSFDPTAAAYDEIEHLIVGRVDGREAYEGGASGANRYRDVWGGLVVGGNYSALEKANEICRLMNGQLLEDENGDLKFSKYDGSASAVDHWTVDKILPGSFKQETIGANVINRLSLDFGYGQDAKFAATLVMNDLTSQSTYAIPGGSDRVMEHRMDTRWLGAPQLLQNSMTDSHTSLTLVGAQCAFVSGNKSGLTVDADHPVWLMLDSGHCPKINNIEIVKATGLTRSTTVEGYISVLKGFGGPGALLGQFGPFSAKLTFTNIARAQLGTIASKHNSIGGYATIAYDITPAVILFEALLKRFGDGCQIVELKTPANKFWIQLNDLVTFDWPEYLAYGMDGVDSTSKWEVVGKDLDAYASPPSITWRLAHAYDTSPSIGADALSTLGPTRQSIDQALDPKAMHFCVGSGLALASVAGLDGKVGSGHMTNGVRNLYLLEDQTITCVASKDTYVYGRAGHTDYIEIVTKQVSLAAGDPGADPGETYLGYFTTDGAGITTVTNRTGQTIQTLNAFHIDDDTLGAAKIKLQQQFGHSLNLNSDFSIRSRG